MSMDAVSPLRQRMIEDMNARKLCAGIRPRVAGVHIPSLNHARTCRSMGSPTVSKTLDWRHMDQERTHETRDHPGRAD
jgi:hypothetical protein